MYLRYSTDTENFSIFEYLRYCILATPKPWVCLKDETWQMVDWILCYVYHRNFLAAGGDLTWKPPDQSWKRKRFIMDDNQGCMLHTMRYNTNEYREIMDIINPEGGNWVSPKRPPRAKPEESRGTPEVSSFRDDYLPEARGELGVITFCHSSRSW